MATNKIEKPGPGVDEAWDSYESDDVGGGMMWDLEEFVMAKDDLSGPDIKAICTEAGLLALRKRRMRVVADDLRKAKEKVLYRKTKGTPEGLYL
ncbi:uncharacterized protein EV422DRAFT_194414 [Fimicolochytrium jonesii]|uniref:uncharacterized protein n=1 Tax=Fimicolochytrium jonesii TaxID=1396493 RepID=UPI0022FF330A|nr:uncharacterized protein EV422DRAFT_194414 [Fimicolochytrium jonesii]KAI8818211.1 hypothetical protein EV422DRAFT_194414 [Fimicolochytrium jonesii]